MGKDEERPATQPRPGHRVSAARMPLPLPLRLNESCTCFAATAGSGPRRWTRDIRHHAGTTALQLLETGCYYCRQKEFCSSPASQHDRQQTHNLGSSSAQSYGLRQRVPGVPIERNEPCLLSRLTGWKSSLTPS